jgi:hypothetical protein
MKKDEPAETPDNRPAPAKGHYPGLHGKVLDWADHRFEEGMLLLRVRFMDETELCWTIQTATVIAEADLCDWKTGNEKQLKVFTKGESDWE